MTDREYLKRCKLLGCNTESFNYIAECREDSYIVDKLKKVLPEARLEQLLAITAFEAITQEGTSDAIIALANTFGSEFAQQVIDGETRHYGEFINKLVNIRVSELKLGNLVITWKGSKPPVKITWVHNNNEHTGLFSKFIFIVDEHLAFISNMNIMYKLEYDTHSCEWYLDNTGIDSEKRQKAMGRAGFVINRYL